MSNETGKREIVGWIYNGTTTLFERIPSNFHEMKGVSRARLIIEEPERKIEITEADLRDCFDSFQRLDDDHDRRLIYSFHEFTKQKLFGSKATVPKGLGERREG